MGRIKGQKQKRTPKLKDKKQSERFKEAARELGADQDSGALDRILGEMIRKPGPGVSELDKDRLRAAARTKRKD